MSLVTSTTIAIDNPTVVVQFNYLNYKPGVANDLMAIAREINSRIGDAFNIAVEIGKKLNHAKKSLHHGDFEPWVVKEFPFSLTTARRYRDLADWSKSANVEDLPIELAAAQILIKADGVVVQKFIEQARAGKPVAHAAVADAVKALKAAAPRTPDAAENQSETAENDDDRAPAEEPSTPAPEPAAATPVPPLTDPVADSEAVAEEPNAPEESHVEDEQVGDGEGPASSPPPAEVAEGGAADTAPARSDTGDALAAGKEAMTRLLGSVDVTDEPAVTSHLREPEDAYVRLSGNDRADAMLMADTFAAHYGADEKTDQRFKLFLDTAAGRYQSKHARTVDPYESQV